MAILDIAMRYLHIVAAILAVGGTAFVLLCLSPALRVVNEQFAGSVMEMVRQRFLRVLWFSIAALTISGGWNWYRLNDAYRVIRPWGQALIGSKVLLAFILFGLIWAQAIGMTRLKPRAALMINVHLAAIIILLGSILRYLRMAGV